MTSILEHAFGSIMLEGEKEWSDIAEVIRSSFAVIKDELVRHEKKNRKTEKKCLLLRNMLAEYQTTTEELAARVAFLEGPQHLENQKHHNQTNLAREDETIQQIYADIGSVKSNVDGIMSSLNQEITKKFDSMKNMVLDCNKSCIKSRELKEFKTHFSRELSLKVNDSKLQEILYGIPSVNQIEKLVQTKIEKLGTFYEEISSLNAQAGRHDKELERVDECLHTVVNGLLTLNENNASPIDRVCSKNKKINIYNSDTLFQAIENSNRKRFLHLNTLFGEKIQGINKEVEILSKKVLFFPSMIDDIRSDQMGIQKNCATIAQVELCHKEIQESNNDLLQRIEQSKNEYSHEREIIHEKIKRVSCDLKSELHLQINSKVDFLTFQSLVEKEAKQHDELVRFNLKKTKSDITTIQRQLHLNTEGFACIQKEHKLFERQIQDKQSLLEKRLSSIKPIQCPELSSNQISSQEYYNNPVKKFESSIEKENVKISRVESRLESAKKRHEERLNCLKEQLKDYLK